MRHIKWARARTATRKVVCDVPKTVTIFGGMAVQLGSVEPDRCAEVERELVQRFRVGRHKRVGKDRVFVTSNPEAAAALISICWRVLREHAQRIAELEWHDLTVDDLIQEGAFGVLRAAEKYDPSRPIRFVTYAAWWIRERMQRAAMAGGANVRSPVGAHNEVATAGRCGLGESERTAAVRATRREVRLEHQKRCGGSNGRGEIKELDPMEIVGYEERTPQDEALDTDERTQRAALVRDALTGLDDIERRIVRRRFFERDQSTYSAIGADLGISRQRVQQLEARALEKLERALDEHVQRLPAAQRRGAREMLVSA